jgi:hypothetical protein
MLSLQIGNAGAGGAAKSGPAVSGSGPVTIGGSSTTTDPNGSSGSNTHTEVGNAYSGAGGIAEGGSVSNNPALVKLFSGRFGYCIIPSCLDGVGLGNGGKAGDASSGSSGPIPVLLSSLTNASPRRGRRIRVARFYKINLD